MFNAPLCLFAAGPRTPCLWVASLTVLTTAVPSFASPAGGDRHPDLDHCPTLRVPDGQKVAFHAHAEGDQIYRWDGMSWVFEGPEALLTADVGGHGVVGIHYAGPTWESVDGSRVVGVVLERCFPDPDAIPWLLLAAESRGPGHFHRISFIQRVDTTGGKAPDGPGLYPGEIVRVPYTAEYYFYRMKNHR